MVKNAGSTPGQVAQLAGASFLIPEVSGFNSQSGTYPGCRFHPWLGYMQEIIECGVQARLDSNQGSII